MSETTLDALTRRVETLERVVARLIPETESPGTIGKPQPNDPVAIAAWVAAFDAIPPIEMTPAEEAEWQAARRAQRSLELSPTTARVEGLRGIDECASRRGAGERIPGSGE